MKYRVLIETGPNQFTPTGQTFIANDAVDAQIYIEQLQRDTGKSHAAELITKPKTQS